jgi:hypothetical protein
MQRSWKNKIRRVLEMIPPLRGGDFQGIAGLSSDDSLLAENQNQGCQGQLRTKRLPSHTGGWKSSYYSPLPVEGEVFFLTFPFIDQAMSQSCAFSLPF